MEASRGIKYQDYVELDYNRRVSSATTNKFSPPITAKFDSINSLQTFFTNQKKIEL